MPIKKFLPAKLALGSGDIKTLDQLLEVAKKTPLSKAAKTTPERLNRMIDNLGLFKLEDIYHIAQAVGIDDKTLLDLIHSDYVKQRRKRKA